MEINTLISMANQIGSFFKSFPDKEQASKDIVFHINRFWTLEMRKEIKDNVSKGNVGSDSLDDMVFDAISKYLKV
jgi:formate dehydrogenase subunit delta|tara:strand:+ start:266 stop:490 length:225 start_codon:yes stop_codon:yes gene_type:complete